jgi:hypothetical protein
MASIAGLVCSTMLLSIVTVDAVLVRDYDEDLARIMAKQQGGPNRQRQAHVCG